MNIPFTQRCLQSPLVFILNYITCLLEKREGRRGKKKCQEHKLSLQMHVQFSVTQTLLLGFMMLIKYYSLLTALSFLASQTETNKCMY